MAGSCIVAIGIEETCGQASEPPIAQPRVGFLIEEANPIQVLRLHNLAGE